MSIEMNFSSKIIYLFILLLGCYLGEKIGVKASKREKKDRYTKINRDDSDKKLRRSRSRLRSHSRKRTQDKNIHGIERIQRTSRRRNYRRISHRKYSREGSTKIEDLKISSAQKQDGCKSTKKSSKSVGGSTRLGVDKNNEPGVSSNTSTMIKQRLAKIEFLQSRYKLRENLKKYMAAVIQDIKENTGGIKDRDPVKMGKVKILRKRLVRLKRQMIKVTNTLLEKDPSENSGSNGTAPRPVKSSTVTSAGSSSLQTDNKSKDGVSETLKSSKNKKSSPVDKIAVRIKDPDKNNKMVISPKEVTIAKETSLKISKKDRSTVVFQTSTNPETQKEESQIETGLKVSENVVENEKSKNLENKHSAAVNNDTVPVDSSDGKENEANCPKSKPEENSCSSKDFSKEIIVNVVQSSTNSVFEKKEFQTTELGVSGKLIEAATFEDSKNSTAPAEKRTILLQSSYDKISSTEKIPGDNQKTHSGISENKIARKSSKKEQKSEIKEIAFTESGGKELCAAIDVRVNENSMECSSKQILQENLNIKRELIIYLTNIACQKYKMTKTFGSGKEFNDESLRHPQIETMKHGAQSTEGRKRKLNSDKTLVVRLQRFFHNEEQKKEDSDESISKTDHVNFSVPKKRGRFVKRRLPTDMIKMSGKNEDVRNSNDETEKLEKSNFSNTKPEPNKEVIFVDESSDEETSVTFISKKDLIAHKDGTIVITSDDNSEDEVENTNIKIRVDVSTDDGSLDTEGDSVATNISRRDIGKSDSNVAKNIEESCVIKESTSNILLSKGKNTPFEKSNIPEEVIVIDRNIFESDPGKNKSEGIEVEINEETPLENSTLGTKRDNCNDSTSQVETKEITSVTKKTPAPIEDLLITGTSITSSFQKYPLEKVQSSNINIGSFETNEGRSLIIEIEKSIRTNISVSESTKSGVDMQQKTSQALSENKKVAKDSKSVSIEEAKNIISQVCSTGTVEATQDSIISTETQIKLKKNTGEPKDAHLELLVGTEKKIPTISGSSTKSYEKSGVREEIKSIIDGVQCKKTVLESSDSTKSDNVVVPDENISEETNILNKNIAGDSIEFYVNPVKSNDGNEIGTEIKKIETNKRKCTVEKEGLEIIGDDADADITSGTTKFNKKTEEPNELVANETISRDEITIVDQITKPFVKSSVEIISENSSEMEDPIVCSESTSEMKTKVDEIKLNAITIIPQEKITDNDQNYKIGLEGPTQSESMIDIDLITATKEANSTGTEETPVEYETVTEQSLREKNKPDSDG